jgi:hypothetical protein
MTRYLEAAKAAVETLLEKQSVRAGGKADGPVVITVSRVWWKRFRSAGAIRGEKVLSYDIQGMPMDERATRMDLACWDVLERLSEVTGDGRYKALVAGMAGVFTEHGYEKSSGLGYLGEEGNLDAEILSLVTVYLGVDPQFKPLAGTPLWALWEAGPEAAARMIRSAYLGLITRPSDMSYNRHCYYGFDDKPGLHPTEFNSHYSAFAMTGALLIEWWGFLYGKTGEADCLAWAEAMAAKWERVQHPESGLMPAWFSSDYNDRDVQPPVSYCNYWDTITGIGLLKAAAAWRARLGGQSLAERLEKMGTRVMQGFARHGYMDTTGAMPQWLSVDGSPRTKRTWYTFYSEEEKAEFVAKDPILSEVPVFGWYGFYTGLPWVTNAGVTVYGSNVPWHVAQAAAMTGDAYLTERAAVMAEGVIKAARGLKGGMTESGQWTVTANAVYVKMMVCLYRATGERKYLDWGREIAEIEMGFLEKGPGEGMHAWWQLPLRNSWIEALVELHAAVSEGGEG